MKRARSVSLFLAIALIAALAVAAVLGSHGSTIAAQAGSPVPACAPATPPVASPPAGSPVAATPVATTSASPEAATPTASGCVVLIDVTDSNFMPTTITIPASTAVRFVIHNTGTKVHSFEVPILHVNVVVQPGETKEITLSVVAGDYQYTSIVENTTEPGFRGTIHAE